MEWSLGTIYNQTECITATICYQMKCSEYTICDKMGITCVQMECCIGITCDLMECSLGSKFIYKGCSIRTTCQHMEQIMHQIRRCIYTVYVNMQFLYLTYVTMQYYFACVTIWHSLLPCPPPRSPGEYILTVIGAVSILYMTVSVFIPHPVNLGSTGSHYR